MSFRLSIAMVLSLAAAAGGDLPKIKTEPNVEKRIRLALDNADRSLTEAREAYDKGEFADTSGALVEVKESVELADASLKQSGKKANRSPKWFKYAELKTSELLRRLDNFEAGMSFSDRPMIQPVKSSIQRVHDALLDAIMGKGK